MHKKIDQNITFQGFSQITRKWEPHCRCWHLTDIQIRKSETKSTSLRGHIHVVCQDVIVWPLRLSFSWRSRRGGGGDILTDLTRECSVSYLPRWQRPWEWWAGAKNQYGLGNEHNILSLLSRNAHTVDCSSRIQSCTCLPNNSETKEFGIYCSLSSYTRVKISQPVNKMRSHCLFPVVDNSGTSCHHLVTRLIRPTDSQQVVHQVWHVLPVTSCWRRTRSNLLRTACISLVGKTCSKFVTVINLVTRW